MFWRVIDKKTVRANETTEGIRGRALVLVPVAMFRSKYRGCPHRSGARWDAPEPAPTLAPLLSALSDQLRRLVCTAAV